MIKKKPSKIFDTGLSLRRNLKIAHKMNTSMYNVYVKKNGFTEQTASQYVLSAILNLLFCLCPPVSGTTPFLII